MNRLVRVPLAVALASLACCSAPARVFAFDSASRPASAAACSVTIEAAAHAVVGGAVQTGSDQGYRAQDIVVDPVLRKMWVRVADCSDSRRPLTLVPISAPLATAMNGSSLQAAMVPPPVAAPVVHRGETVDVIVQSATMHMTLHGKAAAEAGANSQVEVLLDGDLKPDEAPKRIKGIAVSAHRVEVNL